MSHTIKFAELPVGTTFCVINRVSGVVDDPACQFVKIDPISYGTHQTNAKRPAHHGRRDTFWRFEDGDLVVHVP